MSLDRSDHTHFWPSPPQYFSINFWFPLICINMQKIRLFHLCVLEILQSDWALSILACISRTRFPKYGISARIQKIIWAFFTDQIQKKLMTKFPNKSKKPYFWPIFPISGTKKFFKKNPAVCHAQQHIDLYYHAEFQKKLKSQSLENFQTEGRTDGQTLIHRTLPATAGIQKSSIPGAATRGAI